MSKTTLIHPIAEISPPLEGDPLAMLCDLFKKYGQIDQLDPIVAVRVPEADGSINGTIQILSGRTSLAVCEKLGMEPRISFVDGERDLEELAAAITMLRRHLEKGQRAAAGVMYERRFALQAKNRQKAAGGDRKSLLTKVSKAISSESCSTLLPLIEGKTRGQWMAQLHSRSSEELRKKYCALFPDKSGNARFIIDGKLTSAIVDEMFRRLDETPATNDEAIHARKKAAVICDVSEGYIGQAKVVFEKDQAVYHQLLIGKVNLGQARSVIKRQTKRNALASGPLEKPRIGKEFTGIQVGDCNVLIPKLPRRKIRLVFADPPYNIGVDYGDGRKADKLPDAQYLAIHERWIKQLPELLTPDGAAWVLINDEYAAEFVVMLKRAGLKMRNWVKWYETFGTNCSDKFNRTSRHLLYFVRDPKRIVFNHEVFKTDSLRKSFYGDRRAVADGKLWDDVWQIPRLQGTAHERIPDVPTQLPLALVRPIIEGCTEPGDLVFDPFSGSGTTAVACKMTGRDCLAIEMNPEFARLSQARLAATTALSMAAGGKA